MHVIFILLYGLYVIATAIFIINELLKKDYRNPEDGSHVPPCPVSYTHLESNPRIQLGKLSKNGSRMRVCGFLSHILSHILFNRLFHGEQITHELFCRSTFAFVSSPDKKSSSFCMFFLLYSLSKCV